MLSLFVILTNRSHLTEADTHDSKGFVTKLFKSPNRHIKVSRRGARVATAPSLIAIRVARVNARASVDSTYNNRLFCIEACVLTGDVGAIAISEVSFSAFDFVAATAGATKFSRCVGDGGDVKARIEVRPLQ